MTTAVLTDTTIPEGERLPQHVHEVLDQTARLARNVANLLHLRCLESPHDRDADALHDLAHDLYARVEALRAWAGKGSPVLFVGHHTEAFAQLVAEVDELGGKSAEVHT